MGLQRILLHFKLSRVLNLPIRSLKCAGKWIRSATSAEVLAGKLWPEARPVKQKLLGPDYLPHWLQITFAKTILFSECAFFIKFFFCVCEKIKH